MSNPIKNSPIDLDPELGDLAKRLDEAAERIQPDPAFQVSLEQRLKTSHSKQELSTMPSIRRFAPALLWILAAALMVFVLDWAIRSLAPERVPASLGTPVSTSVAPPPVDQPTAVPSGKTYDWHGTTLTLATVLPDSPAEADVYLAQPGQHATVDEAAALAQRFGIQGDVYQTPGELPDTTDYLVTDGKQSLRVRSAAYFSYTADMIKSFNYFGAITNPDADSIIGAFLRSHGFNFPYRLEWSELRGAYKVEALAADGSPLRYEFYAPPTFIVSLDENGQVSTLQASLLDVQADPVGTFRILSAAEALQRVLDPSRAAGIIESMHSAALPIHQWSRTYPMDQTLTIYGKTTSVPSVRSEKPAFIQIDGFPAVGQVTGLENVSQPTYVEATGHFITKNGIERFNVDSWKVSPVNEDGLIGTLQRENYEAVLTTTEAARYVLPDVPDDIPMPFENAFVVGTAAGDVFQWKLIDNRMAAGGGGGGGGGGGSGFYKLNLSGTPVPFPTPTQASGGSADTGAGGPQYTVQEGDTFGSIAQAHGTTIDALMQANAITDPNTLSVGQALVIPGSRVRTIEGLRGMLSITISKQQDGSQLVTYGFLANATSDPGGYMLLEGADLKTLQAYNSRPVDIWGSLDTARDNGIPVVKVDRFEIPFPDLKAQVFRGAQKISEIAGQPATLFTSDDGQVYVQLLADGTTGSSLIGSEGNQVQVEALAIPGETLDGHPALRVFGGTLALDPKTGLHMNIPITADKPHIIEIPFVNKPPALPAATIEKFELIHFLSDPRYAVSVPGASAPLFQPVWRIYGHYSNGDEFEILIQALRYEYLLPEVDPYLQGG